MGQSDPKIAGSNPHYLASSGATFHTKSTPTHHTTTKTLIPQVNQVKRGSPRVLPTRAKGSHTQSTRAIPGNKRKGNNPSCPHQYSEPASSIFQRLSRLVQRPPPSHQPLRPTPQGVSRSPMKVPGSGPLVSMSCTPPTDPHLTGFTPALHLLCT